MVFMDGLVHPSVGEGECSNQSMTKRYQRTFLGCIGSPNFKLTPDGEKLTRRHGRASPPGP